MNPIFLDEKQITELASVGETIDLLEKAFQQQATGEATSTPRNRLVTEGIFLNMMAGAIPGYFGYKAYATGGDKASFMFFLFDSKTNELLSIMQASRLGKIRTGAATGLGTRLMARKDAEVATIFGAGGQAGTQLLGMDAARSFKRIWVVNRTPEKGERFIEEMAPQVKAELKTASSAEEAVGESQVVTTITGSRGPVLFGKWIGPGTHINAAGGNLLLRAELDRDAVLKADRIVVDSIEQARIECGELIPVLGYGRRHWDEVQELKDVVRSGGGRETPEEITLFKSLGVGLEDVAVGALIYERARERGVGIVLDL